MSWHYAEDNGTKGPIPEGAFEALVRAGRVKSTTLVWREGMADWIPLSEAAPEILIAAASPPATGASAASSADTDQITCIECGGQFPRSQAVGLPGGWVCAMCKPLRVQKLKEGAVGTSLARAGLMNYAGFWIRFAAKFLDGLIMGVVLIPLYIPLFMAAFRGGGGADQGGTMILLQLVTNLAQIAVSFGYNTFFIGKYGATPGKMVCGIKVVSPDGQKISYARALGRAAAEILSAMICYIGYIIAGFDSEKRALHDHIATTRVIYGPKF